MSAVKHPGKFTPAILEVIKNQLPGRCTLLDPFAGTGRIHDLCTPLVQTYGIEIEPEWAELHPRTIIGNALSMPFRDGAFDVIATSCTYGNRFADKHKAKDGSTRHSYTHDLREMTGDPERDLHPDNSGGMQWGDDYKQFHIAAWTESIRVLEPRGMFLLNCKDHIRQFEIQEVTNWHIEVLRRLGLAVERMIPVAVTGMRKGRNHEARVANEFVVVFIKS